MVRITPINDSIYHVYNRGVDKRNIFGDSYDIYRLYTSLAAFNTVDPPGSLKDATKSRSPTSGFDRRSMGSKGKPGNFQKPLVEIIAFHLLPNHYHLLLKQEADHGISEFMRRVGGGYTKYFNEKYDRSGALFQGKYKCSHIISDEHLRYLIAYVIQNDVVHNSSFPFAIPKKIECCISNKFLHQVQTPRVCHDGFWSDIINHETFQAESKQLALHIASDRVLSRLIHE